MITMEKELTEELQTIFQTIDEIISPFKNPNVEIEIPPDLTEVPLKDLARLKCDLDNYLSFGNEELSKRDAALEFLKDKYEQLYREQVITYSSNNLKKTTAKMLDVFVKENEDLKEIENRLIVLKAEIAILQPRLNSLARHTSSISREYSRRGMGND